MDNKNANTLNMLQTTQTCLTTNKAVIKDVPSIAKAATELGAIVTAILTAQRQQTSKLGLADEKSTVRIDLTEAAHEVAALAHACSAEHGHDVITKRTDLSLSDVQAGTEGEVLDRCKGILADANELTEDLGDCGLTPAKLKNLKDLITEFEDVKPKPRAGVAVGKSATEQLRVLFRRATRLLRGRLDRLIVQFKKTEPEFFNEYQAARKIVNLAATRNTAGVKVVKQPNPASNQAKAA